MRVTGKQLQGYVDRINARLWQTDLTRAYTLNHMGGIGYRLESNGGSMDVSERLEAREFRQFLLGFMAGLDRVI